MNQRVRDVCIGLALAAVAVQVLAGCGSASPMSPTASRGLPCPAKPTGALCIKVVSHHLEVNDVIGYIVSSEPTLSGRTWRLVLNTYPCDPGQAAQPMCPANGEFPGPARHDLPPAATSCRASATGAVATAPSGCHDTLGQAMGSLGDWAGFEPLTTKDQPVTFKTAVWLCVSEQLLLTNEWRSPDNALAPTPRRACKAVHGA